MQLHPTELELDPGEVGKITPFLRDERGDSIDYEVDIDWASSNPAIATVQPDGDLAGAVTAVSPGTATITAKYRDVQASLVVTVIGPEWRLQAVTDVMSKTWQNNTYPGVQVSGDGTLSVNFPQTMRAGETVTVSATFSSHVTWTGPDPVPVILNVRIFSIGLGYITPVLTKTIGTPNSTISGSVSTSGSYVVPAIGPLSTAPNKLEFVMQQGTNLFGFALGDVRVTYTRVP